MLTGLLHDLRYAVRQLRKSPGFTTVAIITLALGIGANTAIFSLMNAIMLRTLPVRDPKSLVSLRWTARSPPQTSAEYYWPACPDKLGQCVFSYPMFELIRTEQRVFSDISAFMQANTTVHYANHFARSRGLFVSGDFFSTLGGRIAMGRPLNLADDARTAPPVVVLSQQFWQRAFNGDPGVIGKPIFVGKARFTVIGVATPAFSQLDMGIPEDFWLPLTFQPDVEPNLPKLTDPTGIWLGIIARLKPGMSARQATAETDTTFAAAATHGLTAIFKPADSPHLELPTAAYGLSSLRYRFFHPLFVLLISVAIVLLIACANIAGLMLVRSSTRRKEIAMRSALGATRARIVRQLFTESILLSIAGGGAGIMLGYLGAHAMAEFLSLNVQYPLDVDVHPDPHVLGFTLLVSLFVGLLFGLAPAFSSRGLDLVTALRETGAGSMGVSRSRWFTLGNGLVVIQTSLAILVLAGAGLLARTVTNLKALNIGFEAKKVLLFNVDATYTDRSEENLKNLGRDLQERLGTVPGVSSVSYSSFALLRGTGFFDDIKNVGPANLSGQVTMLPVATDFFRTMRIPLLAGRTLSAQDLQNQKSLDSYSVAVVSESFVRKFFGKQNPLGQHFQFGSDKVRTEIVGVVSDARYNSLRNNDVPLTIYVPIAYTPTAGDSGIGTFEVRTALDPKAMMPEIRATVSRFDPNLLVTDMKTQVEQVDQNIYQERLIANLSSIFAILALVIACVGTYGLLSYQVTRRTREIGIRLALGAKRGDVLRLVIGRSATLTILGVVIGVAAALTVTRYLQSFLFGVRPSDPMTIAAAAFGLIAVALLASYIPARRGMKTDPMVALRYE